jgi:hypothetical protein
MLLTISPFSSVGDHPNWHGHPLTHIPVLPAKWLAGATVVRPIAKKKGRQHIMAPLLGSESTSFTLDNMGRFLCNTLQEALDSTTEVVGGRKRAFDTIIIGGGTFGSVVAEHLYCGYDPEPPYSCPRSRSLRAP